MGRSVSVVLITHDSARYLRRCLDGIRSQTIPLTLVVVDNASRDDSLALTRSAFPDAIVVANRENVGFAAAANRGIAATTSDYVALINPDVFLQPDYIERLVVRLDAAGEKFGAATGKLLRGSGDAIEPTGVVDSKGIVMTRSGRHFDREAGERDSSNDSEREVFGVSGAAAVYRRTFLDDVAMDGVPFDNDFFAYREDADLAWRGQLMGWKALYVPDAIAYHVRRVTPEVRSTLPPEINMHSVKNRFLLRLKNEGAFLALRNAPFELFRDLVVLGATLTVERTSFRAWSWLWHHRRDIMRKRREIQARRRVSDRELARWFGER